MPELRKKSDIGVLTVPRTTTIIGLAMVESRSQAPERDPVPPSAADLEPPHPCASTYRREGWWPGERHERRFARLVAEDPGRLAVADSRGRELTRHELWSRASSLAARLAEHGIGAGDAVVVMLPNVVEWQVAFLALLMRGAVGAPAPMTTDTAALRHTLDLIGARAILVVERHGLRATGEEALAVAREVESRPLVARLGSEGEWTWSRRPRNAPQTPRHPEWLDQIMFTSSTTGLPKAVQHSADTLAALNMCFAERHGVGPAAPIFMPSPLGHSVGTIHGGRLALYTGAPLVIQERWDPEQALQLSERYGCAFTAAATPFLKDLVDLPAPADGVKLSSLRTFLCGGAPVPPALMDRAERELPGTFVTVLWGMTEGGVTTCPPGAPREKRETSAGTPLPGLELRILELGSDERVASGAGELAMRGPGVFLGYAGQPELYESLLTGERFFRTGDLAEIDADGYLHITGRLKDLIIRGGVNLSPIPLENCLAAHPAIAEVAVIGMPDERLGERICAVVVPSGPQPPDLDSLLAWASKQGLSRRLWPEQLRIVADMPRTAAGKIRKPDLRERLVVGE